METVPLEHLFDLALGLFLLACLCVVVMPFTADVAVPVAFLMLGLLLLTGCLQPKDY